VLFPNDTDKKRYLTWNVDENEGVSSLAFAKLEQQAEAVVAGVSGAQNERIRGLMTLHCISQLTAIEPIERFTIRDLRILETISLSLSSVIAIAPRTGTN